MKIGLALSGGGIRGMAHIGALKALHEYHIFPDMISGSSAGSIVAGLYAYGYSPDEIASIVRASIKDCIDINYLGILYTMLHVKQIATKGTSGLIRGNRIEQILKRITDNQWMYEAKRPLAIPAVRVHNGDTYYFVSNTENLKKKKHIHYVEDVKIYEAIRSSISFPFLFQPKILSYKGQELWLIDGGVSDNLPAGVLFEMGADRVIGINLGYNGKMEPGVSNFIEITEQSLSIMMYYMTKHSCPVYKKDCYIYNPEIWDISLLHLEALDDCIQKGYEAMKKEIPRMKAIWGVGRQKG